MTLNPTKESLDIVEKISKTVNTFHHHYHILYDIANQYYGEESINYIEIGAYAGGSASLMMHRKNTKIISIDIGQPIEPVNAIFNVNANNFYGNSYTYIHGDSSKQSTINQLEELLSDAKIDILFIDGDHGYNSVIRDFNNYVDFVNDGGFIIFDDYNDNIYSPEVKLAVNDIISKLDLSKYSIIGSVENVHCASPKEMTQNNCFILRKVFL